MSKLPETALAAQMSMVSSFVASPPSSSGAVRATLRTGAGADDPGACRWQQWYKDDIKSISRTKCYTADSLFVC